MTAAAPDSPRCLYLARHGQSLANLEKRISGQMDWPLTEKGLDQARCLADVLRDEPLAAVYASNLSRAVETARPTAEFHGLDVRTLGDLRERRFGSLEGRRVDQSDPEGLALWERRADAGEHGSICGEEPLAAFRERVQNALKALLAAISGPTLLVGHRNTNALILQALTDRSPSRLESINVKNKYVYKVNLDNPADITTIRLGGERHGQRYAGLVT